jgi:epoxyqueuosine reductase
MTPTDPDPALADGSRCVSIPVERLADARGELAALRESAGLNRFQDWVLGELYRFDLPDAGFPIRSIVVMAVPHPLYAPVRFTWEGRACHCMGLVTADVPAAEALLRERLAGWRLVEARDLPLKRLAVQAGLASYGRNNITYVEGLGSCFSYAAFFSDRPCGRGTWTGVRLAERCGSCRICVGACPTGALRQDRFLVDTDRCLSFLNEGGGPFPAWLGADVHHTLYDCLRCQLACPMNRGHGPAEAVDLSEDELRCLLSRAAPARRSPRLNAKAAYLGLDHWPDALERNVMAIFAQAGGGS